MQEDPFETLLLDFDGTIADSIALILAAYRYAFTEVRGAPLPDVLWLEGVGTPLISQLEGLAQSPDEVPLLLAAYRRYAIAEHDRLIRSFPTMRPSLESFRAAGVPMGVVTSKNRVGLDRGLGALGLQGFFSTLIATDDTEQHKPHPAPVLLALERLGAEAERTLFVGDSLHDLEAGRAAGVRTAAALWGPFTAQQLASGEPDYWVEDPLDLLPLFGLDPPRRRARR
jgi:pyrophosphatase PpaX